MSTLDTQQRGALDNADFAYIDSDGGKHLPINDAAHVRAAMARFDQTQFASADDKAGARGKILAAAKKYDIEVKDFAEPNRADDPGGDATPGDVHVDAPLTKRSPMLKRLMQGLRKRVASARFLTAEDLEAEYRSALGHTGGKSRNAAEPADAEICPACQAAGHGAAEGCTCPACMEGDPDDCVCQALMDQDDDDVDPSAFSERHWLQIPAGNGESLRLFVEQTFAEGPPPEWVNVLPTPGTYKHPTYGEIAISGDRNANFIRNFKAGVYQRQLPVDAEHESKLSGALGWITDARQNGDGSVDAHVDWTDRGQAMYASDRFKYFSPEWYDTWTDPATAQPHSDVLIGGALTTRPFFKEGALRPLVASEHGIRVGDDSRLIAPETSPRQEQSTMTEPTTEQLTEDEIKRFRESESELKSATERATAAEAEAKQAAERVSVLERENRRRAFAEQACPWHGETAGHVDFMEALPSEELRTQYAEQQTAQATALAEAQKEAQLFKAVGTAGIPASGAVDKINQAAAALRASEPTLTIEQARARATKENPALYAEYEAEITG